MRNFGHFLVVIVLCVLYNLPITKSEEVRL